MRLLIPQMQCKPSPTRYTHVPHQSSPETYWNCGLSCFDFSYNIKKYSNKRTWCQYSLNCPRSHEQPTHYSCINDVQCLPLPQQVAEWILAEEGKLLLIFSEVQELPSMPSDHTNNCIKQKYPMIQSKSFKQQCKFSVPPASLCSNGSHHSMLPEKI
jgi:hypothetical protein